MHEFIEGRPAVAPLVRAAFVLLALGIGLASPVRGLAQQPSQPTLTVNEIDASTYPDIRAVVTVLNASGIPATNLGTSVFAASGEPGVSVTAASAAQDSSLALAVVLVIDTSGSMGGAPIQAAREAASRFVSQLGPNDQVLLLAFSGSVRPITPFTSDRVVLANGINGLAASGETSLYDAVRAGVFAARSSTAPRRAVVILSDGENDTTTSDTTEAQSLDAARGARVPVFTVAYGQLSDTGYLQRVASETRGSFYPASTADVGAVYGAIGTMLRNQYVLTLHSNAAPDGKSASLRLTASVDGQTATSEPVQFNRGSAPPPRPVEVAPRPAPAPIEVRTGNSSNVLAWAIGAIILAGALAAGAFLIFSRMAAGRAQRRRERYAGQHSDEPMPAPQAPTAETARPELRAQLVGVEGADSGTTVPLGEMPVVIGSDSTADVRLEGADIAARHATVWIRDGMITLRHTGGMRPTLVDGRPVDVVILDGGDEFSIGSHRYRAEILDAPAVA